MKLYKCLFLLALCGVVAVVSGQKSSPSPKPSTTLTSSSSSSTTSVPPSSTTDSSSSSSSTTDSSSSSTKSTSTSLSTSTPTSSSSTSSPSSSSSSSSQPPATGGPGNGNNVNNSDNSSSSSGGPTPASIGLYIAIGVAAAACLVGCGGFVYIRNRRSKHTEGEYNFEEAMRNVTPVSRHATVTSVNGSSGGGVAKGGSGVLSSIAIASPSSPAGGAVDVVTVDSNKGPVNRVNTLNRIPSSASIAMMAINGGRPSSTSRPNSFYGAASASSSVESVPYFVSPQGYVYPGGGGGGSVAGASSISSAGVPSTSAYYVQPVVTSEGYQYYYPAIIPRQMTPISAPPSEAGSQSPLVVDGNNVK